MSNQQVGIWTLYLFLNLTQLEPMQDTFYLNDPEKVEVAPEMLDLWAKVHEHGHDTGSKGWGVKFDKEEAQKGLLRTHTTVNTIRHIAENPHVPSRVFGIGRVSVSYTHLTLPTTPYV